MFFFLKIIRTTRYQWTCCFFVFVYYSFFRDEISILFFMLLNKFVSIIHENRLSFLSKNVSESFYVKIRSRSNSSNNQRKTFESSFNCKAINDSWRTLKRYWNDSLKSKIMNIKIKNHVICSLKLKAKDINYFVHKMKLLT
jgi:hypothetical protein